MRGWVPVAMLLAAAACRPDAGPPANGPAAAGEEVPTSESAVPSFDCARADSQVQELVCADAGLAALDQRLDSVFAGAVARVEGFADAAAELSTLRALQRGWIGGRDECWKEPDVRACTEAAYRLRIAELQARYVLVEATGTVFWACESNPANEFVTTFLDTDPPTARVERGDRTEIAVGTRTPSGSRYEAPFGSVFWILGDTARVEWPQGTHLTCVARDRR